MWQNPDMDAPAVSFDLPGWTLVWASFVRAAQLDESTRLDENAQLESTVERVLAEVREQRAGQPLISDPAIAALRKLLRAAGCDPTRYRSSPEALLRRLLKGEDLPRIHPLVDIGNLLSARLGIPCCMLDIDRLKPPFTLRAGRDGERYESLRGDFNLAGKPLLADVDGPCDTPITGSRRAGVTAATERAWFVAYLPAALAEEGGVDATAVERELRQLVAAVPAWTLESVAVVAEES